MANETMADFEKELESSFCVMRQGDIVSDVIVEFDYKCEETPNNPFGALLVGIKVDE